MIAHRSASPSRNSQSGMMILEALIAILVFSLGILAIVALQAISIKLAGDAKYRSDASLLAEELLAKMWVSDRVPADMNSLFGTGASACNGPSVNLPDPYVPGQISIAAINADGSPTFAIIGSSPLGVPTLIVSPPFNTPAAIAACAVCAGDPTLAGCTSFPTYSTWLADVRAALPGTITNPPVVVVDTTAGTATTGTVTVVVRWQAPNDGFPHSHTVTAQIR